MSKKIHPRGQKTNVFLPTEEETLLNYALNGKTLDKVINETFPQIEPEKKGRGGSYKFPASTPKEKSWKNSKE